MGLRAAGIAVLLAGLALGATPALADSCPGAFDCPYTTFSEFGSPAPATFARPQAIAVDGAGNVIVGDQQSGVVRKFDPNGVQLAQWGQFLSVGGVAADASGDVYVLDTSNNQVDKFDPNGNLLTTWGKRGTAAGHFRIGWKGGIAVGGSYVYVSDSDNERIQKFDLNGNFVADWTTPTHDLNHPLGLTVSGSRLLVADDDNHRLVEFTTDGGFIGAFGSGPGTHLNQFWNPYDVAVDRHGNVFVADNTGDRIVELDPSLTALTTWGSDGSAPGYLKYPRALAMAPNGDLLVANTGNNRIDSYSFTPIPPTLTLGDRAPARAAAGRPARLAGLRPGLQAAGGRERVDRPRAPSAPALRPHARRRRPGHDHADAVEAGAARAQARLRSAPPAHGEAHRHAARHGRGRHRRAAGGADPPVAALS